MAPADRRCAKSKRAYVTFLAGGGDYVKGAIGLAKGLRRVKSAYPLVVAVLPDVPEDHRMELRNQACILKEIQPISPPHCGVEFAMAYYVLNYSKLRIWEFEDYSKMVYLDADTQVYHNIDDLFERDDGYLYAVMDCFCEKTWSHSPQYKIGYCQQCPEKCSGLWNSVTLLNSTSMPGCLFSSPADCSSILSWRHYRSQLQHVLQNRYCSLQIRYVE